MAQNHQANLQLLVQYCLNNDSNLRRVTDRKRVYTIFIRPKGICTAGQRSDFVGPFTTSCEAQTRIVPKHRTDTVIGGKY